MCGSVGGRAWLWRTLMVAPVRWATNCQGTRLEWCSITCTHNNPDKRHVSTRPPPQGPCQPLASMTDIVIRSKGVSLQPGCGRTERMISSPALSSCVPHVLATRLIASVAPLVKTISSREAAFTKVCTPERASR